jgi:hypothetical protein
MESTSARPPVYPSPLLSTCDPVSATNWLPLCYRRNSSTRARAASYSRCLDHTQLHTTVGRTSVDEKSARGRDLCLITHNIHK